MREGGTRPAASGLGASTQLPPSPQGQGFPWQPLEKQRHLVATAAPAASLTEPAAPFSLLHTIVRRKHGEDASWRADLKRDSRGSA